MSQKNPLSPEHALRRLAENSSGDVPAESFVGCCMAMLRYGCSYTREITEDILRRCEMHKAVYPIAFAVIAEIQRERHPSRMRPIRVHDHGQHRPSQLKRGPHFSAVYNSRYHDAKRRNKKGRTQYKYYERRHH